MINRLRKTEIFPHETISPGKELSVVIEGEVVDCLVESVLPLEGNKFLVWLKALSDGEKIQACWFFGKLRVDLLADSKLH